MATAYQPTPRWEQSVPMGHENLPLANQALFDSSYSFDPNQATRDSSNFTSRRPSQHAATLDVDTYQLEQIKRDSGRSMRKGSSHSRGPSPQKSTVSHIRRPSTSHSRPSASITIPRAESEAAMDPDPERSAWIHRDKLAQIESQELAAAGFGVPRATHRRQSRSDSRSASRSASRNAASRVQPTTQLAFSSEINPLKVPGFEEQSGAGANQDQDSDEYEERLREEPRVERAIYSRSLPRPTVSRIPVARASPAPVSQSVVERDSPLPRSMSGSLGDSASSRTRSRSLGNPGIMTEPTSTRSAIPSKPRPRSSHIQDSHSSSELPSLSTRTTQSLNAVSRAKAMNKAATGGSMGKKTVPRTTSKARNPSNSPKDSPVRRPTSGSTRSRPGSFHMRPEGEAPWVATMYKPDPRLPPDQQMLPTHAKRAMQGGSDSQDETDKSYPLNIDSLSDEELARIGALPPPESAQQPETTTSKQQDANLAQPPWPLTRNKSDSRSQAGSAKGTHGGYTITPKIAPPIAPPKTPKPTTNQPDATRSTNAGVQRVPDLNEKEDGKKKKLACCIVM